MALTYHNNNSISNVTSFAQVPTGSLTLLSTATASSSASLSFDSTYINGDYQIYKFEFINIHANTNNANFQFQCSIDNGSNYNVTVTNTLFRTYHFENDGGGAVAYEGAFDLAQSTSYNTINYSLGNSADDNLSGELSLFNPSSEIFVKHFISKTSSNYETSAPANLSTYLAGYFNNTNNIDAINFKMSSGTFSGQIKLYGLGAN